VAPHVSVFPRLLNNNFSESGPQDVDIRECSWSGGVRPGCDLEADTSHTLHILFNGTVNHTAASNTFKRDPSHDGTDAPI